MDFKFQYHIYLVYFFLAASTFLQSVLGGSLSETCSMAKDKNSFWTTKAQKALYAINHPLDCVRADILLCSTRVNKFQGSGSRLFFLGRCLAEGLNSGRAVVLSNELPTTHDILSPFKPWSNCTLEDSKINARNARIKSYYPMDSFSLRKSSEMPGVGALYPKSFGEKGYWWWKAQEISYALRPTKETLHVFEKLIELHPHYVSLQLRRTDKTQGCSEVYGKRSPIKCKREASAPKLMDFVTELKHFDQHEEITKYVRIVTDDVFIDKEIEKLETKLIFLKPDPAPRRTVDKARKGGIFKDRSLKDAIDILTMARGDPFIFTYSSGFGALALQLKQTHEDFCSNWVSLDWGKREWPPIGTASEGGVRGVRKNSPVVSDLCKLGLNENNASCNIYLKSSIREKGARIVNICNCGWVIEEKNKIL